MLSKNRRFYLVACVTVFALLASVFAAVRIQPQGVAGVSAPSDVKVPTNAGVDLAPAEVHGDIVVIHSEKNDTTPALRTMKMLPPPVKPREVERNNPLPLKPFVGTDTVVQSALNASVNIPAASVVFEGINQAGGCGNCAPPDTNGDIGVSHYVQTVNSSFAIYNRTGTKLYGPAAINTVWQGFGGACETRNDGDPILLYDNIADRWLISQFTAASPYYECIAISQSGDPTGAWYRYAFQLSTTDFPDYPKFGVWPDGYYMSVNWFRRGTTYQGPRPYVFDRAKMLLGQAATLQTTSAALGSSVYPIMPTDLDGATLPPTGSPNIFISFGSSMKMYKFAVNWVTPASTTWTNYATLTPSAFTSFSGSLVPQSGTTTKLDTLGDRLMTRVVYRNMGTYQSLLATHVVAVSSVGAVRWYEIRNPITSPAFYQQGTYAPGDGLHRWMSSIAMDKLGDIALGFSGSSSTAYPSIRYTARLSTSTLGVMDQGEGVMYQGTGSQSGVSRWGDYSNLSIDPVDDCTFWFTTEYNNSFGWAWATKIGAFKLANCN